MIRIRYILSISLCFLSARSLSAQELKIREIPDINPYAGTWLFIEGHDTLIVELEPVSHYFEPLDTSFQSLSGKLTYIKEGKIKVDHTDSSDYWMKYGRLSEWKERKYLGFNFYDELEKKFGHLALYIDEHNENQLFWELRPTRRIFINEEPDIEDLRRFSVPNELTLVRIDSD